MRVVRNGLYDSLLNECDHAAKTGLGTGCYIEEMLERQEELGLSRREISSVLLLPSYILRKLIYDSRFLGATLMDAGAETSAAFLQAFVLALLSYPEFQKHIQTEIDTVIGSVRMPNFADYEQLPYLRAFISEVSV